MPAQYNITKKEIDEMGSVMRPGQPIRSNKLFKILRERYPTARYNETKFGYVKREMLHRGLLTEKRHSRGSYELTLHNPPVPADQRTLPRMRYVPPRAVGHKPNGAYAVRKTFELAAGSYTACQLRSLAREVLRELGELK